MRSKLTPSRSVLHVLRKSWNNEWYAFDAHRVLCKVYLNVLPPLIERWEADFFTATFL